MARWLCIWWEKGVLTWSFHPLLQDALFWRDSLHRISPQVRPGPLHSTGPIP